MKSPTRLIENGDFILSKPKEMVSAGIQSKICRLIIAFESFGRVLRNPARKEAGDKFADYCGFQPQKINKEN